MKKEQKSNLKNITYIMILFTVLILLFTGYSIGKSINQTTVKSKAQIAEPIIEVISEPKINVTDIENQKTYTFYVRNYNNENKVTEAKIQYYITIKDTIDEKLKNTIKYELYQDGQKVQLTNQSTNKIQLSNETAQQKEYKLKINYDKQASEYMQDILETIQIQVHSEQEGIN